MKRKFLIVLLSLVCCFCLALGLTACGNSSGGTTDSGQNNEQTGNTDDGSSSSGDNTDSGSGDSSSTDDGGSSSGDSGDSGSSSGDTEQDGSTGGGAEEAVSLEYILSSDNSSYIVSGIGGVTSTTVTIPSTCNGLPVTAIADGAFKNNTIIVIIIIADSVTTIGENAFSGCTSLTTATIGSGVTTIGASAFSGCSSLTSVNIPSSVTSIGANAFKDCVKIVIVIILGNPEIADGAFSGCVLISDVTLSDELLAKVAEILNNVFADSTEITEVKDTNSTAYHTHELIYTAKVEATCTEAGTEEYWYCSTCDKYYSDEDGSTEVNKDSLTIATTVHTYTYKYDEDGHWQVCEVCGSTTASEDHTLDDNNVCTVCGYEIFTDSIGLEYTLSDDNIYYTVSGIGTCTDTKLVIPSTYNGLPVTAIAASAFVSQTQLTGLYIPDSITSIGSYAFDGCTSMEFLTIGSNVTSIGSYAFKNCTALTSINYNATAADDLSDMDKIFYCAGQNGTGIAVTIGANVTEIPNYLFCTYSSASSVNPYLVKITSVVFEEGSVCESIGKKAFGYCNSLSSIIFPECLKTIGSTAFMYCSALENIVLPESLESIGYQAFAVSSLKSITIPDNVTSMGYESFKNCALLTTVIIGNGVTTIAFDTFSMCESLTSITLGSSLISIASTFGSCYKLVEVYNLSSLEITAGSTDNGGVARYAKNVYTATIGESHLFYDGDYLFYNDDSTYYLMGYVGSETDITLPENINGNSYEIYDCAFYYCLSLTSITIPDSVTYIGRYAFQNCTALTSVTFENISGWYVTTNNGATSGKNITSSDLADTSTAATYLKSTYRDYYWYRSED